MESTTVAQAGGLPLGTDRPSLREQLSFASGEVASNLAWNMVGGFLLYYYTDVALLPVAALGTLMLLSRVLDAVFDPLVGVLVDRTRTRWGQARPYLLFASLPFGILCVLTFAVPDFSATGKVLYAYVTFTLLGLAYSFLCIPYSAMQPMVARDPRDKVRISSWRAMSSSIGSIIVYSLVLPLAGLMGLDHKRQGFIFAAAVIATLTIALYLLVFLQCKERYGSSVRSASQTVRVDIKQLLRNPVWRLVFVYALLTFVRLGTLVSVAAYFCKTELGSPAMVAVMLSLLSVAILAGGSVAALVVKRFGTKAANVGALLLSIAIYLVMPLLAGNTVLFLAAFMLANATVGIVAATVFAACTDAVEYHEQHFGTRTEGLVASSVSFGMKVGMAIGAAVTAYVLAWAAYDPIVSSAGAGTAIRWLFYYVPALIMALQIVCMVLYREVRRTVA
jgi:GPH family glycoside/pentoside/hexuronide:cation symporter